MLMNTMPPPPGISTDFNPGGCCGCTFAAFVLATLALGACKFVVWAWTP